MKRSNAGWSILIHKQKTVKDIPGHSVKHVVGLDTKTARTSHPPSQVILSEIACSEQSKLRDADYQKSQARQALVQRKDTRPGIQFSQSASHS